MVNKHSQKVKYSVIISGQPFDLIWPVSQMSALMNILCHFVFWSSFFSVQQELKGQKSSAMVSLTKSN